MRQTRLPVATTLRLTKSQAAALEALADMHDYQTIAEAARHCIARTAAAELEMEVA